MSLEEKRKQYKCGEKYKTLSDVPTWPEYAKQHDVTSKFSASDFVVSQELNQKVSIFTGDITAIEIDSVVNAANEGLRGGGGGLTTILNHQTWNWRIITL